MYASCSAPRSAYPAGGCAARPGGRQQARRAITCAVGPRPTSGLQRQVSASAYVGSWGEQQQQLPADQQPVNPLLSMFSDIANGFFARPHSQDPSWEGIPKEYLEDHHGDHCSWGHSHIAERLANESSSKLHRAYDQVAADL